MTFDNSAANQYSEQSSAANGDINADSQPIKASAPKYKNILCIEDEHFIGELYTRALSKAGYNAKVIIDGAEGLKEALTNKYDIILLDIMVPTITGTEILKKLREPNVAKKLKAKIIVTTNLEQKDETKAEIEKQADGYIVKAEITPKQLVRFLQSLEK